VRHAPETVPGARSLDWARPLTSKEPLVTDPYGVIDLAALKQPAGDAAGGGAVPGTPSPHEIAVTEQGLEQLIADSQQIPTLLLVTSARVPEGAQFLEALRRGVDAQGGA